MTERSSCLLHQLLQASGWGFLVLFITGPCWISLAHGQTGASSTDALAALEKYLDEECDLIATTSRQPQSTCGIKRLVPYKNNQALITKLKQILSTDPPDGETSERVEKALEKRWLVFKQLTTTAKTREDYFQDHRDRIIRIYHEKAALGLATVDAREAEKLKITAEQHNDQVLAEMLGYALLSHP